MKLQKFVMDVLEALGGIVIPLEYALCQVMIPEEYKDYFQERTELELAFDYEVAEENPQAEFVTFGSYWLEQILALVERQTVCTLRFVEPDRLTLTNPLEKIQRFMEREPGKLSLVGERTVMSVWAVFSFNVCYIAEGREEESRSIWIDLASGTRSEEMERQQHLIAFSAKSDYTLPISSGLSIAAAFGQAYGIVKQQAELIKKQRVRSTELEKEVRRIKEYYAELSAETLKRSERKGLSEQKQAEFVSKLKSIELEEEKQVIEMENKYSVQTEIALDHGILYVIPQIEYQLHHHFRNTQTETVLHYNLILKQFSIQTAVPEGIEYD
ncbi:MAG: hypothetical protein WD469_00835 [Paenibacillaceae bacterium]